jgi:mannose-6-phosphate isomerase-like protein (cupin superfamily)
MSVARHPIPPDIAALDLAEVARRYVARFRDCTADWAAFEDAKLEGYRRAQHRFIGGGGSGKHADPNTIPPRAFTLSIMYVPPGQGNAAHTHEVEEVFFVLRGHLTVFIEDQTGGRISTKLGPWDCIACPPGVIHGYSNDGLEPVYLQVMLGKARPDTMGYADEALYARRNDHLG